VNGNEGHHFDDLLELLKLGLVATEEAQFGALLWRQSAESINLAVGDLVLS
jgi:hypothetical protein